MLEHIDLKIFFHLFYLFLKLIVRLFEDNWGATK